MEIALFYSKKNSEHLYAADLVKKAVKNLGISAKITERDIQSTNPKFVVDGYDLNSLLGQSESGIQLSYDSVLKVIESNAW